MTPLIQHITICYYHVSYESRSMELWEDLREAITSVGHGMFNYLPSLISGKATIDFEQTSQSQYRDTLLAKCDSLLPLRGNARWR